MSQMKIGLVGIGKLGSAMMKHWYKHRISIGVYHPTQIKTEDFIKRYPNGYSIEENEISEMDVLLLALPADRIMAFLSQYGNPKTLFINMATSLNTKEVKRRFPDFNIAGLKFMGHSNDLSEHGNGLFISEQSFPNEVLNVFKVIGKIEKDSEETVVTVNKLATYQAVKASIEIEEEFEKRNLPSEYIERALTSLSPEVMRSYSKGNLGHFGKEIVKEIKDNKL